MGDSLVSTETHSILGEDLIGVGPAWIRYFPCRLRDEGRESKPVEVLVLLQVSKRDDKELGQGRWVTFSNSGVPDLASKV